MDLSLKFSGIFLLFTFFCSAQGLNYKVTYKENIGKRIINDTITVPKTEREGVLIGNSKRADYYSEFRLISKKRGVLPGGGNYEDTRYKLGEYVFKDFKTKKQIFKTKGHPEFGDPDIVVYRNLNYHNWTLTNETKKIGDFNCRKATGVNKFNEKVTCWYTDELGIIGAPKYFDGLPGLVILLESEYENTVFELLKIEYPKTIKFKTRNNNFIVFTEKKYRNPPPIISDEIVKDLH